MIENNLDRSQRDRKQARRKGVAPSSSLSRHFIALARQVRQWAESRPVHKSGCGTAIGVTSLASGAGTSTVSFNLACALTSLSRSPVLLVESDFGKHSIARRLGFGRSPGLGEMLLGLAEYDEAVFPTPLTGLSVLGSGPKAEQDSLSLPFEILPNLINEKLNEFGFLVFDLPLANHLTACHSITPYLEGVILTVESNQIDQQQISRFRRQLESQAVEIIGIVLNKA